MSDGPSDTPITAGGLPPTNPPTSPPLMPAPQGSPDAPVGDGLWSPPTSAVLIEPMESVQPASGGAKFTKWIAGGIGAVLLVGAGVFAFGALRGTDGGSKTPESAVDALLASFSNEDPVAMINSMAPSEMRTLGSAMQKNVKTLDGQGEAGQRLVDRGVDLDLNDLLPGLQIDIKSTDYKVEDLGDDVARVDIASLDATWSFDPQEFFDRLDIEKISGGLFTEDDLAGISEKSSGNITEDDLRVVGDQSFVMAVREQGKWYVSPMYTVLEYLRVDGGFPKADFSKPTGWGADSPEAAIEQMVRALGKSDVSGVIEALPPGRYKALYAYQDMLTELIGDSPVADIDVDIAKVKRFDDAQGIGVKIVEGTIVERRHFDYARLVVKTYELDDDCLTTITEDRNGATTQTQCLDDFGEGAAPFEKGIPGIDKVWVVQQQEGGKYYVDPLGTISSWLGAIDEQALDDLVDNFGD